MNQLQEQEYYYQLGINIRDARKAAGLSQGILADMVGVSRTSMVNVEKGKHRLYIHVIILIAEALNKRLDNILPSRTTVKDGDKIVAATLPKIISDKSSVDSETEQAVANFFLFLNNK